MITAYHTMYLGEMISLYFNLDEQETNGNFDTWDVDLYHAPSDTELGSLAYPGIFDLTRDGTTSLYRFYMEDQPIPLDITQGCYRLVISDSGTVLYISKVLKFTACYDDSLYIRYRNANTMLNYGYSNLSSSFYNTLRIPLKKERSNQVSNKIGHPNIDGSFKTVRNTLGKTWEFVTGWFNDALHEAFNAAMNHSSFQVYIDGEWKTFLFSDDSSYATDFQEDYPLIEGLVRLQEADKASSNKTV